MSALLAATAEAKAASGVVSLDTLDVKPIP